MSDTSDTTSHEDQGIEATRAYNYRVISLVADLLELQSQVKPGEYGYAISNQPIRVLFDIARTIADHPEAVDHAVPLRYSFT